MSNPFQKKEEKRKITLGKYQLATTVIGLLIALITFSGEISKLLFSQTPCKHSSGFHNIQGLSLSSTENGHIYNFDHVNLSLHDSRFFYKEITIEDTISESRLQNFNEEVRRPQYYKALRDLLDNPVSFPVSFDTKRIKDLLEEEKRLGKGIFTHNHLDKIFRVSYDSLSYDCNKGAYTYKYAIAVPRYMDYYLHELRKIIGTHVQDVFSQKSGPTFIINKQINIGELVQTLRTQTTFEEDFCMELKQDSSYYSLFKDLTMLHEDHRLACQLKFELGDYQLHPAGIAILEHLADIYVRYMERHRGEDFTIKCMGYADAAQVRGKIAYKAGGRWQPQGKPIRYLQEDEKKIAPAIQGNLELSYARAYSGIQYLAQYIRDVHGNKLKDTELQYEYVGMGVDQRIHKDKQNQKRIEILLSHSSNKIYIQ